MRLRDIATVLEEAAPKLISTVESVTGQHQRLTGFQDATRAAEDVQRTGALSKSVAAVLKHAELTTNVHSSVVVTVELAVKFSSAVDNLRLRCQLLANTIQSLITEENLISFRSSFLKSMI